MEKECIYCGKIFYKKPTTSKKEWGKQKFCSQKCHYNFGREVKECPNCHKKFKTKKAYIQVKFCSSECRAEYKRQHPEEYNLFREGHKGYNSKPWLGKKLSKKHKDNISQSLKKSEKFKLSMKKVGEQQSGKNHWNWKGGISRKNHRRETAEYKEWRSKVYARDYWTCQKCGKKLNLVAHHINPFRDYPELRFDVSNGLTLCRLCHKKVHEEIGKQTRWKRKISK
ncbi:MAG: HNH endonuclease [Elusimicrobiota bacterium]